MKTSRIIMAIATTAILLFSAQEVWAGASTGVGCCTVVNPGSGALAIKGTLGIDFTSNLFGKVPRADVLLRLERTGLLGWFTVTVSEDLYGKSNEEIACCILNPSEPDLQDVDRDDVSALVKQILEFFFEGKGLNPTNTRLVITRASITNTNGPDGARILEFNGEESEATDRFFALADIVIYAISTGNVRLDDPDFSCGE